MMLSSLSTLLRVSLSTKESLSKLFRVISAGRWKRSPSNLLDCILMNIVESIVSDLLGVSLQ